MIYEMRTYTFAQGTLPKYLKLAETVGRPVRGNDYGTNHGYWVAEFGQLNQVWHLWSYDSHAHRDERRAALSKNERWVNEYIPNIRGMLVRQDIRFLNMLNGPNKPAQDGNVYELRMYRTNVGQAGGWAKMFKDAFATREKYSKNVFLATGEAPQPNEALHMWSYPDLNTRAATRAKLAQDPDWQAFVAKGANTIVDMHATLLLPTAYSVMK